MKLILSRAGIIFAIMFFLMFFVHPKLAFGQAINAPAPSVVSAVGTAEITKVPEVIRLQIKQYGKGTDTETARAALLAAEKKLIKGLRDLGSEIIVATAGAAMTSPYRSRYLSDMQMLQQRRQLGGIAAVVPVDPNKPVPTILERWVIVDLKPGKKHQEVMTYLLELQEKLRKDHTELTGLSAVWMEENGESSRETPQHREYYANQQDIGLHLAAKVTKPERLRLYSEAFQRAHATAQELAEAASAKIGRLHSLSSSSIDSTSSYRDGLIPGSVILANGEIMNRSPFKKESDDESLIIRPFNYSQSGQMTPLTFQVRVNVSYQLDQAK